MTNESVDPGRTMIAGAGSPASPGATQMGATISCPVCHSNNPSLETYCVECGFLLSSTPGAATDAMELPPVYELVENSTGRRFQLNSGVNTVGREHTDVLLIDSTVSRRHAEITLDNGLVILRDLGSSNGTHVDGRPIGPNQPLPLPDGAVLKFGSAVLTLVAPPRPHEEASIRGAIAGAAPRPEAAKAPVAAIPAPPPPQGPPPPQAAPSAPQSSISTPPPSAAGPTTLAQLKPTSSAAEPIYIGEGSITIGRRTGNDVVITNDPYISGKHAEILCDQTGCYLSDTGSTNGTTVNGQKLEPYKKQLLLDGDEVGLGQSNYVFETLPEPEEAA